MKRFLLAPDDERRTLDRKEVSGLYSTVEFTFEAPEVDEALSHSGTSEARRNGSTRPVEKNLRLEIPLLCSQLAGSPRCRGASRFGTSHPTIGRRMRKLRVSVRWLCTDFGNTWRAKKQTGISTCIGLHIPTMCKLSEH